MMAKAQNTPLDPAIHSVRLDKLRIFEISEAELEELERGSPESIFLNLALAVLSIAISFSVSLFTTRIESNRTFIVFVVVTAISHRRSTRWFFGLLFKYACLSFSEIFFPDPMSRSFTLRYLNLTSLPLSTRAWQSSRNWKTAFSTENRRDCCDHSAE
jgi:hypothetical protein